MNGKRTTLKALLYALLLFAMAASAALAVRPDDASGFVLVSDAVPDAILEIRYYSTYNFVGERIDGYEEPVALLTREAAEALRAVSEELMQKGYRLKIYDAYRPQMAVDRFMSWAQDSADVRMKEYFYPELEKSALPGKYISRRCSCSAATRASSPPSRAPTPWPTPSAWRAVA